MNRWTRSHFIGLALSAAVLLPSFGCGGHLTLKEVGNVTHIKVTDNYRTIRVISDPSDVTKIVDFVNSQRTGWGGWVNIGGTPSPQLRIQFFDGEKAGRYFGVGPGFFWATASPIPSTAKHASTNEVRRFLDLIGVDYPPVLTIRPNFLTRVSLFSPNGRALPVPTLAGGNSPLPTFASRSMAFLF